MFSDKIQSTTLDLATHRSNHEYIKTINTTDLDDIYFVDTSHHITLDTMLSDIYDVGIDDSSLVISTYNENLYPEIFYENNPEDIAIAAYDDSSLLEEALYPFNYVNIDDSVSVGGYHNNDWLYYWATSKTST